MRRLYKKAMRDLLKDKHRALAAFIAIFIGMTAFGVITFCYIIITREIPAVYSNINAASASVMVDRVDDNLLRLTENFEAIHDYEAKGYYNFRVRSGEEWKTLELFAAENYLDANYNRVQLLDGRLTIKSNEALIEGDALRVADLKLGGIAEVMLDESNITGLSLVGVVNDLSVHPAVMHNVVYLYINFQTLNQWGLAPNKIDFIVSGDKYDREHIMQVSNDYISLLESNGYTVMKLAVEDTPGESMHMSEYEGALFLLQIFSIVSLIFGCMIISGLLSSIINAQIRQVGILKAIGGSRGKIFVSYTAALMTLIITALCISLLMIKMFAGQAAAFLLGIGNMKPSDVSVPGWVYIVFIAAGLLLPLLLAARPLFRGLNINVKSAVNDYGITPGSAGNKVFDAKILPRTIILSLRNALRRKGRFALNVVSLVFGGAMFVAVLAGMLTVNSAINQSLDSFDYDYQMVIGGNNDNNAVAGLLDSIDSITKYEFWETVAVQLLDDERKAGGSYTLISPESGSTMMKPQLTEGRWAAANGRNEVVVTYEFLAKEPQYHLGGKIMLKVGEAEQWYEIVGVLNDFSTASIYMSRELFVNVVSAEQRLKSIKLQTNPDIRNKNKYYRSLDEAFEAKGIYIYLSESKADMRAVLKSHYAVTLQTFLLITLMIVAIAGFGLSAAMNVQTSERIREIGVMKALGAGNKQIFRIITSESIFIALVSWCGAIITGLLLSVFGISVFGSKVLEIPLNFIPSGYFTAVAVWLLIVSVVGYLASRKVAKRTVKKSIKDVLILE